MKRRMHTVKSKLLFLTIKVKNSPRTQHSGIEREKICKKGCNVETRFCSPGVSVEECQNEELERERDGIIQINNS